MIADRSYHRLLHLDWIRADVDVDSRREYVPHNDHAGPDRAEPCEPGCAQPRWQEG